jgi:Mrp family chromosome partitioning ATPase
MSPVYYRDLLLRTWWLLALCAILAGLSACVASVKYFPVYQVSTYLKVDFRYPPPGSAFYPPLGLSIGGNATTLLTTEAQLAVAPSVLAKVAAENPGVEASRLRSKVSVAAISNSLLLEIIVQDSQPKRAASIANDLDAALVNPQNTVYQKAAADETRIRQDMTSIEQQESQVGQELTALGTPPSDPTQASSLQTQLSGLQQQLSQDEWNLSIEQNTLSWTLQVTQPALPPSAPNLSRIAVGTAAGLASGALLGFLLALGINLMVWPVRSAAAVEDFLGVPLLGEISSRTSAGSGASNHAGHPPDDLSNLGFQLVRALDFLGIDAPLHSVAVVSAEASTLASMIAANLAVCESLQGRRTLLVDAQLATGRQSQQFGIPPSPGLSNAALDPPQASQGGLYLLHYAHSPTAVNVPQLLVLPSGTPPPNPAQVLASRAMDRVLSWLPQTEADSVILDAPPLLGHPRMGRAASVLLRHVDGVLLVVDLEHTRKDHLLRAQRLLAGTGVRVLGCVVAGPPVTPSADGHEARHYPRAVPAGTYPDRSPGGTSNGE